MKFQRTLGYFVLPQVKNLEIGENWSKILWVCNLQSRRDITASFRRVCWWRRFGLCDHAFNVIMIKTKDLGRKKVTQIYSNLVLHNCYNNFNYHISSLHWTSYKIVNIKCFVNSTSDDLNTRNLLTSVYALETRWSIYGLKVIERSGSKP